MWSRWFLVNLNYCPPSDEFTKRFNLSLITAYKRAPSRYKLNFEPKLRNVEPFNLFGKWSLIWNSSEALSVVRANTYYFYVIIGVTFVQYFNKVFNSLNTPLERTALLGYALLLTALALLVRYKMSRVAAIFLLMNFAWNFLGTSPITVTSPSMGFVFMGLMVAVSYRTLKATIAYAKYEND